MAIIAKVVVVTGANRGIGQGLAHAVASLDEPVVLFATSRAGLPDPTLKLAHPASKVEYAKLDYQDAATFAELAALIKSKYGKLDVLINNGAVLPEATDGFTNESVRTTIDTNLYGPAQLTDALLPLMSKGGRIVHISSMAAQQFDPTEPLKSRLTDPKLTVEQLSKIAEEYVEAAKTKDATSGFVMDGFMPIYSVSKALLNVLAEIQARENPALLINSVCPGITQTDMNKTDAAGMPIIKGVRIPMKVALGDIGTTTGKFWTGIHPRDEDSAGAVSEGWMGKPLGEF